jgi:hypothetical protein
VIAASEEDSRDDKFRVVLNTYQRQEGEPAYPTIVSTDREDGTPIPWGALSGLAFDTEDSNKVYTMHDSFYQQSRIFVMDAPDHPAVITDEIVLKDAMDELLAAHSSATCCSRYRPAA